CPTPADRIVPMPLLLCLLLLGLGCRHAVRPKVDFGAGATLPLVRTADDDRWYVVVEGWLDEPVLLFLDSGFTLTTCDDELARALEAVPRGRVQLQGEVGRVDARLAALPPLELGGHRLERVRCVVRDLHTTSS